MRRRIADDNRARPLAVQGAIIVHFAKPPKEKAPQKGT
jgi:hypothetical protein